MDSPTPRPYPSQRPNVLESDTVIDLATNAFTDLPTWYTSFMAAIRDPLLPDPVVLVRNTIVQ